MGVEERRYEKEKKRQMEVDNIKLEILDDINFSNAGYLLRIFLRGKKMNLFFFSYIMRYLREKIIWLVFQTEKVGNNLNALRLVG